MTSRIAAIKQEHDCINWLLKLQHHPDVSPQTKAIAALVSALTDSEREVEQLRAQLAEVQKENERLRSIVSVEHEDGLAMADEDGAFHLYGSKEAVKRMLAVLAEAKKERAEIERDALEAAVRRVEQLRKNPYWSRPLFLNNAILGTKVKGE